MTNNNIKILVGLIIGILTLTYVGIKAKDYLDEYKWAKEVKESYNEIEFNPPKGFEQLDKNKFEYGPNYVYHDDYNTCYASIGSYQKYDDKQWWFNNTIYVDLNDIVSDQEEITINGNTVLSVSVKEKTSTTYYYGFESSNHFYELRYTIYDYNNGDIPLIEDNPCYTERDNLLNSIKLK